MEQLFEILKMALAKSDPMLTVVVLLLAFWIWRVSKALDRHLDPQTPHPHPQCAQHQQAYEALEKAIADLSGRIDTVLKIAVRD